MVWREKRSFSRTCKLMASVFIKPPYPFYRIFAFGFLSDMTQIALWLTSSFLLFHLTLTFFTFFYPSDSIISLFSAFRPHYYNVPMLRDREAQGVFNQWLVAITAANLLSWCPTLPLTGPNHDLNCKQTAGENWVTTSEYHLYGGGCWTVSHHAMRTLIREAHDCVQRKLQSHPCVSARLTELICVRWWWKEQTALSYWAFEKRCDNAEWST